MKQQFFSFYESIKKQLLTNFTNHLAEQYSWVLLSFIFARSKTELIAHSPEITDADTTKVKKILHELIEEKKPIAYIIGSVPFLELELITKQPVLIARPETESLVSALFLMLEPFKTEKLSVLDIGTGSGCISVSFAYHFPHFSVTATDISDAALSLCKENAKKYNLNNIAIQKSDLFSGLKQESFDLIISNPPYIGESEFDDLEPSVKDWEDKRALVSGNDGLFLIRKLIQAAPEYTKKQSVLAEKRLPQLVIEIGQTQADIVSDLMHTAGYQKTTIWKDQYGKDRAVFGILRS